ncbi:MAG: tRNA pseudouridine(38-40) synthase TruA, partial [Muribaculaceae bacterium]|nr:tRNA pseudouridine(38-40) synthase TruA [Muribaculaceae bacterium]
VGRGKLAPADVMDIIDRKDRCAAGTSMPGHALYLWDITYPYRSLINTL